MFQVPNKEKVNEIAAKLLTELRSAVSATYNGPVGCDAIREFVQENMLMIKDEKDFGKYSEILIAAGIVIGALSKPMPRLMYLIVGVDRGDGHHRISTAAMQVWPDPEVAREEMRRWLFSTGHAVLPVEVCTSPQSLGTKEQQDAWQARKEKA